MGDPRLCHAWVRLALVSRIACEEQLACIYLWRKVGLTMVPPCHFGGCSLKEQHQSKRKMGGLKDCGHESRFVLFGTKLGQRGGTG
jgi:hypothetical protein